MLKSRFSQHISPNRTLQREGWDSFEGAQRHPLILRERAYTISLHVRLVPLHLLEQGELFKETLTFIG